jgi:hypothetical protein
MFTGSNRDARDLEERCAWWDYDGPVMLDARDMTFLDHGEE